MNNLNWFEESKKCKKDPVYFYNNYCLINGKKPKPITQEEYNNAVQIINNFRKNQFKRLKDLCK